MFLQRIRDETHRFAISFHRSRRAKSMINSEIDEINGVGAKRKNALIKKFKTIDNIREATITEICSVPGISMKIAKTIKMGLNG
jgi:excinuclease ABC subunit C